MVSRTTASTLPVVDAPHPTHADCSRRVRRGQCGTDQPRVREEIGHVVYKEVISTLGRLCADLRARSGGYRGPPRQRRGALLGRGLYVLIWQRGLLLWSVHVEQILFGRRLHDLLLRPWELVQFRGLVV